MHFAHVGSLKAETARSREYGPIRPALTHTVVQHSRKDARLIRRRPRRTEPDHDTQDPASWPATTEPPLYRGITELQGALAQTWLRRDIEGRGLIALIHPTHGVTAPVTSWEDEMRGFRAVVYLTDAYWSGEPELRLLDGTGNRNNDTLVRWDDMTRLIGMAPPMWPTVLRKRTVMGRWRPGSAPVDVMPSHGLDITPVLALASLLPPGTPAHAALIDFVHTTVHSAATSAQADIDLFAEASPHLAPTWAAVPHPVPERPVVDETVIRAGWQDIVERTDDLAFDSVRAVCAWGAEDRTLPNPALATIDAAADPWAPAWASRLEPGTPKAAYAVFNDRDMHEHLVDPATGAVCVRDGDGILHASVPSSIPSYGALDSVMFAGDHHTIWVKDSDGAIWLAPALANDGITWGYSGGGPWALAVTLGRLLEDLTAKPVIGGTPAAGLKAMCEHAWPDGTVLTRADLEAAVDGRFQIPPEG